MINNKEEFIKKYGECVNELKKDFYGNTVIKSIKLEDDIYEGDWSYIKKINGANVLNINKFDVVTFIIKSIVNTNKVWQIGDGYKTMEFISAIETLINIVDVNIFSETSSELKEIFNHFNENDIFDNINHEIGCNHISYRVGGFMCDNPIEICGRCGNIIGINFVSYLDKLVTYVINILPEIINDLVLILDNIKLTNNIKLDNFVDTFNDIYKFFDSTKSLIK